jgi:hypothetical protein
LREDIEFCREVLCILFAKLDIPRDGRMIPELDHLVLCTSDKMDDQQKYVWWYSIGRIESLLAIDLL